MRKWKPRHPARKPMKLSDGRGWAWRSWLNRAHALWLYTAGMRTADRRLTRDEAREFIEHNAGKVWIAYYPMFGHLTVELM